MSDLALFALTFANAVAVTIAAYWWIVRPAEQRDRAKRAQQQRTPEDVHADAAAYRARREAEQRADDLDICRHLWPGASRAARVAEAQHRHDTAKQQREEG